MSQSFNPNNPIAAFPVFIVRFCLTLVFWCLIAIVQAVYVVSLCLGWVVSLWHYRPWRGDDDRYLSYRWGLARGKILELESKAKAIKADFDLAASLYREECKRNKDLNAYNKWLSAQKAESKSPGSPSV